MGTATPQGELLQWYDAVGRDLPWRKTTDPYRVLVSEVMLQQTQVDRVLDFYKRFLHKFPTAKDLAQADVMDVHRQWKGLGYPSRAERLQKACAAVVESGAWPDTPEGLQALPGIGPYTAHSVSCFAFGKAVPVVDTNVARVYARRDGLPLPLDKKDIWKHAAANVEPERPVAYTNALMDLGATVCTARNPRCDACPWNHRCQSINKPAIHAQTGNPLKVASTKTQYGVKVTDRKKKRLHIALALIHDQGRYLVAKRPMNVPEGGFWELPGGKREAGETAREACEREVLEELGAEVLSARPWLTATVDKSTHYVTFYVFRCRLFDPTVVKPLASDDIKWVTPEELVTLDFPSANEELLRKFKHYHRLEPKP